MGGLDGLTAKRSMDRYAILRQVEAELDSLSQSLIVELFKAVGGLDNKKLRAALVTLKRDVHNLRRLKSSPLKTVTDHNPRPDLARSLHQYQVLIDQRQQAGEHFEQAFGRELPELRHHFQNLVLDDSFRKGLLLSSRTLFDELDRYTRSPAEQPGAKARQVERSLMRYYSRTVMKTTPFGTFCAIAPGRFNGPEAPGFSADPGEKVSSLRLNKAIYARLVKHLLQRGAVRRSLPVELNPTLRLAADQWVFLAESENHELFQRLAPNPVLDLLREALAELGHMPFTALVDLFLENIDTSEEQASDYIDRLLQVGFLRFRLGIRDQEIHWQGPFEDLLKPIDDDHARQTVRFLQEYRRHGEAYAAAPVEKRRELLAATAKLRKSLFDSLADKPDEGPGDTIIPLDRTLFFEDTRAKTHLALDLGDLEDELARWVELTSPLAVVRDEQTNMRHFFDSHYADSTLSVPLLQFYEDYYREHFKEHFERRQEGSSRQDDNLANPFGLAIVSQLGAARQRLTERLRELWRADPEAEEMVLESSDLENITSSLPPLTDPCRSVSLFVQHVPGHTADGRDALVANTYHTGFGKYFSRFLYLLPDQVKRDLESSNVRLSKDELAEICNDAGFNANLHPPLLPFEISYPTGEGGVTEDQIKTSEMVVEVDPERRYRLRLRHLTSGKEVLPVDLGFLNPRLRPPLFQLLFRMTPASDFSLDVPDRLTDPREPSPPLVHRPRVTFHGRLILARRRWTILPELFPQRQVQDNEAAYFLKIQRWREQLGLPRKVFIRVLTSNTTSEKTDRNKSKTRSGGRRQHLHKPQYIDFGNPLLVDLFSRTTENLQNFRLALEECLPKDEQLAAANGERYATEFVVQLDFPSRED